MRYFSLTPLRLMGLLMVSLCMLAACNSKESTEDADTLYSPPTDVAIKGFKLKANPNVLRGLDSVYFSIDLQKAVVFNADSLPKGTDITKLVPQITYSEYISSAVIDMTGGEVRTGTVDYKKMPGDSIDFSGRVTITLTSTSGNSRAYELRVNVHKTEPDSLCWGSTALSQLPSRSAAPRAQRTVQRGDLVVSMIEEADGTYTIAKTTEPTANQWERSEATLPFTPRLRTLQATPSALYILDNRGNLYTSTDGAGWTALSSGWGNLLGAYGDELLGLRNEQGSYSIATASGSAPAVPLAGALTDFPIDDFTNMFSYQSKWMSAPIAVLAGGVTADGRVSDKVWGFDGYSWIMLSEGTIPALRGATLVPYYSYLKSAGVWAYDEFSTLLLLGGMDAEGAFNKDLYLSYTNGLTFTKGSELMQMPEFIPGMWQLDNIVAAMPMQASVLPQGWSEMPGQPLKPWYRIDTNLVGTTLHWQCPYIYLFGGCDTRGQLYNTVWRGVINRLTFAPII